MDKVRVGLIGIGGMGGCHFFNYDQVQNAQIVAVCDVREEMAKEKIGDKKIKLYTDYKKMLKKEKLDMVDICTPSYMHAKMAMDCIKAGVHVLCEKPMTINYRDAKKVLAVAQNAQKNFMVAHVVRFMAPYAYLREVIESNRYGKLLRLDMKRISGIPTWSWEDWMRKEELSGGVVTDLSIHDIDYVQSVFGDPDKMSCVLRPIRNNSSFSQTTMIYGETLVNCEGTWYNADTGFDASYLAVFENGYVKLKDGKIIDNGKEVTDNQASAESQNLGINISNDNGYLNEIQYFVDCIQTGVKPEKVKPESSANSVKIVDLLKKNAQKI